MDSMLKPSLQLSKPELAEKRVIWKLVSAMQELEQVQSDVGARLLLEVLQKRYKDESCSPSPYLVLKGHQLPIDVGLFDEVVLIEGHREALLSLARPPLPAVTQECPGDQQSASIGAEVATSTSAAEFIQLPLEKGTSPLTTREVVEAFGFYPKLKNALGDVNNHRWALPSRIGRGPRPTPSTWDPVKLALALLNRGKLHEKEITVAFFESPILRNHLLQWQEVRRERNAFGI